MRNNERNLRQCNAILQFSCKRGAGSPARESTPQGSLQVGPRSEAPAPPNLPPPHVFLAWLGLKSARHKNYMRNGQNVLGD